MSTETATALSRARNGYVTMAIIWLTSSILAVTFILACYVFTWVRPKAAAGSDQGLYTTAARTSAMNTLSADEAKRCFQTFQTFINDRQYRYRPWVGAVDRPYRSSCLNIDDSDPVPIRRTINAFPEQQNKKTIWLFGSSLTFGFGVPDSKTIASYLSAILAANGTKYTVINYGHTGLYSSQEAAIFTALVRHGQRSQIAIFLDGANDMRTTARDIPPLSNSIADGFLKAEEEAATGSKRQIVVAPTFPPTRILNRLLHGPSTESATAPERLGGDYDPLSIYAFNVSSIEQMANSVNVKVAFFWQPTPFDFLAGAEERRKATAKALASPQFERAPFFNVAVRQIVKSKSFHLIADIFREGHFESLYVDSIHYGDEGSRRVAMAIATNLKSAGLLD